MALISEPGAGAYHPGVRGGWVKVRHDEARDADLRAAIGSSSPPHHLLVGFDDGSTHLTAHLDALQGRAVADALGERLGRQTTDPDVEVSRMIEGTPVRVEVRAGTGRSGVVRLMRVRGED